MNKIQDLKIYKRLLALLSAGVMALSSLPAFAEGEVEETTNETAITMVEEEPVQLTFDEYMNEVGPVFEEKYGPYSDFDNEEYSLISRAFYYFNPKNCSDIRQELTDCGLLCENLKDGIDVPRMLGLEIAAVTVEKIKEEANIENTFDFSTLIIDPAIRELTHNALVNYIEVYNKGTIYCDEYQELMEQFDMLKSENFFLGYNCLYNMLRALHEHCIFASFDDKEIKEYFVLKNNELEDVNTRNYKDFGDLYSKVSKNKEKSDLEKYIVLIFKYQGGFVPKKDCDAAVRKIEKDYKETQKTKQK